MTDPNSTKQVQDVFKLLITVGGIVLGLMWGLLQLHGIGSVIVLVRVVTALLAISIFGSVLGLQFIISETMKREKPEKATTTWPHTIAEERRIAITFLFSWLTFAAGLVTLALAIFIWN